MDRDALAPEASVPRAGAPRSALARLLRALLLLVAILLVLAGTALAALSETAIGRALVAQHLLPRFVLDNGLTVRAARIDGSLLSRFTLRGVALHDQSGLLATAPEVRLAWSPLAAIGGSIRLTDLAVPRMVLLRAPDLIPTPPDEPILPDIRLAIERLAIDRLDVREDVAGLAETLSVAGRIDLREGRLFLDLKALGQRGDALDILLDSVPDADRFDLGARLEARADGLVAALLGIDRPLSLRLSGEGGWKAWRGALFARLGTAPLASLEIRLNAGRLGIVGTAAPAPLLPPALAPAVGPLVGLNLRAEPDGDQQTRIVAGARLAAGTVGLSTRIDRKTEQLDKGALVASLTRPGLLVTGLSGGPVEIKASFAGPLRAPAGSFTGEAPALALDGFGETLKIAAPRLEGALSWGARAEGRPIAPELAFRAQARSVAPLPAALADHGQAPSLSGRLRLADGLLVAEAVRLEAGGGRLVATLAEARIADGKLALRGKAALKRLPVEGVGLVDADADFSGEGSASGLVARGEARVSLAPPATGPAQALLGGPARLRLPFSFVRGVLSSSGGSLASPGLSLTPIAARWAAADGRFSLSARGTSRDYGALGLEADGTPDRPRARLRLASPGLGLGLRDIVLDLSPIAGGFAVSGSGTGADGPVSADARLLLGAGRPLVVEVELLAAGNLEAQGRLSQTAAGPFDGLLTVSGMGLSGRLAFSNQQGVQRIDVDGEAAQARLPLAVPVRVGAGSARLTLLFAPEGLRIAGEGSARNVRRQALDIAKIEGRGSLSGDSGEASLALAGRLGSRPLALGLGLTFDRTGYRAGLRGSFNGVPLRLVGDARLKRAGDGWTLEPARLAIARGTIDVAGQLAGRTRLQLRLNGLDLSILDGLFLASEIRGTLDGAIDWDDGGGAGFPDARAQLKVRSFAAEAGGTVLPTIDALADVRSTTGGLDAAIEFSGSRGSEGRMRVGLLPGPGETLKDRALGGALSGGIRFFGRAETLWSFANVPDQSLSGPLGLVADFSGTLGKPQLSGGMRGEGLLYRHFVLGTRISNLTAQAQFAGNQVRLLSLAGDVQGGKLTGKGVVTLADAAEDRVDLSFDLARARLVDNASTRLIASGPLTLTGRLVDLQLAGRLEIDEGNVQLGRMQSTVATSDVSVRRKGAPLPAVSEGRASRLSYDVRVVARDSVKVSGLGLDSFWRADVLIRGDVARPKLTGDAVLARGTYDFAGRSFDITRGRVGFTGDPLDSQIDIQATAVSEGFRANVLISGTARRPDLAFSSIPPLPEDEVLARLLFGASVADLSAPEALQLAAAVASLRGGSGGLDPLGRIQRASGIDRIRLTGNDSETGMGTGIAIGERLGRNIYVEVATDTEGNALSRVELTLTRMLSVLAHVTTLGDAGINLRYSRDY